MILLLGACSLLRFDWTPCASNEECRGAFGLGSVCADDGYCDAVALHPRCQRTYPPDLLTRPELYRDVILVGALFDHASDTPEVQTTELVLRQVNDRDGLDGRGFGQVQCTYEENPALDALTPDEAAAETARFLVDELGAVALVGPATSAQSEAAFTAVVKEDGREVVFVSPSATSPALTNIDGIEKDDEHPGLWWRTAPPDSLQGQAMAADIRARGHERLAVIYEEGPYGEGLAEELIHAFIDDTHTADRYIFYDDATRDEHVQAVGNGGYDQMVFISAEVAEMVAFLDGAGAVAGYQQLPIFLGDGARDTALLETLTEGGRALLDQVRGTNPAVPEGDIYEAFASAYAAAYGADAGDSSYTAHTYDATWLVLYGIAWASYQEDGLEGPALGRGLRRISDPDFGEPIVISSTTWTEVAARFAAGDAIDVVGASGELDYDPDDEETASPIDIWVVTADGSGFETVDTFER